MSKISTVYDTFLTTLAALFPSKTRIPNAYNLESNAQQFLDDGYGLAVSESSQVPGEFCNLVREQTFNIVLARKMFKNDTDPLMYDTLVKAMQEDVVTIQKDFYNVDRLGIPSDIDNTSMGPVGAVSEVVSGKFNILYVEIPIIVTIRELL